MQLAPMAAAAPLDPPQAKSHKTLTDEQREAIVTAAISAYCDLSKRKLRTPASHQAVDRDLIKLAMAKLKKGGVYPRVSPLGQWLKPRNAAVALRRVVYGNWARISGKPCEQQPRKQRGPVHDITPQDLDACIKEVTDERVRTVQDAAKCKKVTAVTDKHKCTLGYLWRKMREHCPRFGKRGTLRFKRHMTAEQKAARLKYAQKMLARFDLIQKVDGEAGKGRAAALQLATPLMLHLQIDQKLVYVTPQGRLHFWCDPLLLTADDSGVLEVKNLRLAGKDWRAYFYSCVNPLVGAVDIVFCTGTVGQGQEATAYKVSVTQGLGLHS